MVLDKVVTDSKEIGASSVGCEMSGTCYQAGSRSSRRNGICTSV